MRFKVTDSLADSLITWYTLNAFYAQHETCLWDVLIIYASNVPNPHMGRTLCCPTVHIRCHFIGILFELEDVFIKMCPTSAVLGSTTGHSNASCINGQFPYVTSASVDFSSCDDPVSPKTLHGVFTETGQHDDVIKWKHFPRYWPFVRGIHRLPVNSPHKGQCTRSFDAFFDLRLNKRLSKQSWGWWSETSSHPLRRHCNDSDESTLRNVNVSLYYSAKNYM